MARPKNQTARREQLIRAASRAISAQGLARLKVSGIADSAGVTRGSVHYYFSDLSELLVQVHKRALERFFTQRATVTQTLPDARDQLVESIRRGVPDGPDDELAVVLCEFNTAIRDEPLYSTLAQSRYDRQVVMYTAILDVGTAQGHFRLSEPARDVASNIVSLEDSYLLHIVSRNDSLPPRRAFELILGYARTATGCPDLTPDRPQAGPPSVTDPDA
ncbi:TetR/AcrR family transcriptional regulator [Streptomyces sp. NEAU-Y11]|uniref:TetR/AcrR family transcriptional regulator n=1 Tax=Streptomyces cucumeris TaxID=2962890 RepID=UPI0020C8CCD2|nr:TetR family transcriptional regulator [Streptomyces sp. NEAU-Y11]MCP9211566.1 TetR family transcriptional regulator [Streptomyces sp. NEAU-Y11]